VSRGSTAVWLCGLLGVGIVTQSTFLAEVQETLGQPSIHPEMKAQRTWATQEAPSIRRPAKREEHAPLHHMLDRHKISMNASFVSKTSARRGQVNSWPNPCLIQSLTEAPGDCCIIKRRVFRAPKCCQEAEGQVANLLGGSHLLDFLLAWHDTDRAS
jgi:hypothetical protein